MLSTFLVDALDFLVVLAAGGFIVYLLVFIFGNMFPEDDVDA